MVGYEVILMFFMVGGLGDCRQSFDRLIKGGDMKISDVRDLLKDKRVIEEINKHLWIESQKAGYNIGIERATDEWLTLYADGWMRYHLPERYNAMKEAQKKARKN